VFFEVLGPWQTDDAGASSGTDGWDLARGLVRIAVNVVALAVGVVMARRNARAGRTDPRNALVVALCAAVPIVVSFVVGSHHTWSLDEYPRFLVHLGVALFFGLEFWIVYLALEPIVRGRWPHALISWLRLLHGRWRDPLVGRDVLIGLVGGTAIVVVGQLAQAVPEWLGSPPLSPNGGEDVLRALAGSGSFLEKLGERPTRTLAEGLLILYLLLLNLIVLRNRWLAYGAVMAVFLALAVSREAPALSIVRLGALVGVVVYLISRFGLLSYMAAMFVMFTVNDLPIGLDGSVWFAGRSSVTVLMLAAIAAWALGSAVVASHRVPLAAARSVR
jgi:serine/threonine-protein kinase